MESITLSAALEWEGGGGGGKDERDSYISIFLFILFIHLFIRLFMPS